MSVPALRTAYIATGYHIVFMLNKDTVSVSLKPYIFIRAVDRCVECSFTWKKSIRSPVTALVKPAISFRGNLNNGEALGSSKAHSHTVKSVGSTKEKSFSKDKSN